MFSIGQSVMIIGDATCPIGSVVAIANISPCDFGEQGIVPLYQVGPPVVIAEQEVYFQAQHLMPVTGLDLSDELEEELVVAIGSDLPCTSATPA